MRIVLALIVGMLWLCGPHALPVLRPGRHTRGAGGWWANTEAGSDHRSTWAVGRRFDYLTIDDKGRYLFSADLAARLLYVIDLSNHAVVAVIPDVTGVEGLAYIVGGPEPARAAAPCGRWAEFQVCARLRQAGDLYSNGCCIFDESR